MIASAGGINKSKSGRRQETAEPHNSDCHDHILIPHPPFSFSLTTLFF